MKNIHHFFDRTQQSVQERSRFNFQCELKNISSSFHFYSRHLEKRAILFLKKELKFVFVLMKIVKVDLALTTSTS